MYPAGRVDAVDLVCTSGFATRVQTSQPLVVRETIAFSGQASATLRYAPAGSVSVVGVGNFIDIWGQEYTPTFGTPGELVTTADWIDRNTYTNVRTRRVKSYEVVALRSGDSVPAWGLATVEYSTTYDVFQFEFERVDPYSAKLEFKDAFILAVDGSEIAGSLQIQAPNTGVRK